VLFGAGVLLVLPFLASSCLEENMKKLVSLSVFCAAFACAGIASADDAAPQAKVDEKPPAETPKEHSRVLEPMHVDFRALAHTDILLISPGVGASGDVGVVRAGPGTLTLGLGGEYDVCGSACWFLNAVTPLSFDQHQTAILGRVGYHLRIDQAAMRNFDVYGFVGAGPVFAQASVTLNQPFARYTASDTGVGAEAGIGASFFIAGPVFLAGEARYRVAAGQYAYKLDVGKDTVWQANGAEHWNAGGAALQLGIGVRL
jgi:hypothetical protein